jgi:hypothetical protein
MKLFTRQGEEFSGVVEVSDTGKPMHYISVACDRCHVINGQRLWIMGMENGRAYSRTGFDCWTCGNTGVRRTTQERLYTEVELARVVKSANTRATRKAETESIAREQAEAQRIAKDAQFRTDNADFIKKLAILDGDFWVGFQYSFMQRATTPTERQVALVEGEIAKRGKNASSKFLGAIGDKVSITITVERVIAMQSSWGTTYIKIARTSAGDVVTYKGNVSFGSEGEVTKIEAKIKDHVIYNGVKQTVIQRPKIIE